MLKRLLAYLILPAEITDFERTYLARMRRVALLFFFAHLPLLMGVAAVCGTGVVKAGLFGALALVGPTIAYVTFENPRNISRVFGFTAMCMGGLLVHFGQGPMQIEMHFYFFVLLALLAVFGEPLTILVAAGTVTLHHLLLFFLLPRSVFNYDAPVSAVAVHAGFVALESLAACFVARSFFDDVIGLERIVERRTRELAERTGHMRLILDNVAQGLFTLGLDGRISTERSAVLETWLGPCEEGATAASYLARLDPDVGAMFALGWETVTEDVLPLELALDQMPKRMTAGARVLELTYRPILSGDRLASALVVISDITVALERERQEAEQRELLAVFGRVLGDRAGFVEFMTEANGLVERITAASHQSPSDAARDIHTLKGNAGLVGLDGIAALCNALEDRMADAGAGPTGDDCAELGARWQRTATTLGELLGPGGADDVHVSEEEHQALFQATLREAPHAEIARTLAEWKLEPTHQRLARIAEQARVLAARMGKSGIEVVIVSNGLRLPLDRWAPFWTAFAHAVRNAVDHGLETAAERVLAGKASAGRIELRTSVRGEDVLVEIADDGRGIDDRKVAARAAECGLPHRTHADLIEALFAEGLTTKDVATEYSGRGIGMAALRAACTDLGGTIEVASEPARGTTLMFRIPRRQMAPPACRKRPEPTAHTLALA